MKLRTLLSIFILTALAACNDPEPTKESIAPDDVNLFIEKLISEGTVENGAPTPPTGPADFAITKAPSGANVTYDNFMFLPVTITSDAGFDGVYIQLSNEFGKESNAHLNIPIDGEPGESTFMLKFEIPANVEPGLVFMNLSAYQGTSVTEVHTFPVEIVHPQTGCDDGGKNAKTGDQQFGSRTYSFDESSFPRDNFEQIIPQRLTLKAEFFETPDRIDVYVDKQWVGGTGTILAFGEAPPAYDCAAGDLADTGFAAGTKYISFVVKPDQRIDVFVTGCLGSTAWAYAFNCPRGN
jgi:hypothetical protein